MYENHPQVEYDLFLFLRLVLSRQYVDVQFNFTCVLFFFFFFLFLSRRGIFITCQCFGHNSLVVIYHCEERKFNRSRRDNHTNAKQNPWQQKEIEKKKICRFGMGARARMRLKNCNENNSLKWCAFAFARCCKMNSYSLRRHRHHHHHCSQIGDVLFRFH